MKSNLVRALIAAPLLYSGAANASHLDLSYQANDQTQGGRVEGGYSLFNPNIGPFNSDIYANFGVGILANNDFENEYKFPVTLGLGTAASLNNIGLFGEVKYAPTGHLFPDQGHGLITELGLNLPEIPRTDISPYISYSWANGENIEELSNSIHLGVRLQD
tara:strand:- start:394 stop:876 length:483 start_codon:yes stop_codon:yes gene_type:complete